jgi:hypothetical protein
MCSPAAGMMAVSEIWRTAGRDGQLGSPRALRCSASPTTRRGPVDGAPTVRQARRCRDVDQRRETESAMVSSWDPIFLRRRRQLRLSKCSHVVVPRPSQPAVGEVPRGLAVWCTTTESPASHRRKKGEVGVAHSGPSGYARAGRKGPGEKNNSFWQKHSPNCDFLVLS